MENNVENNDHIVNNECSNPVQGQLLGILGNDFYITDEMIEKAKATRNYKGFTIINDKYILIKDGKSLILEIEKCKRLREKGVNYCGPVSYREYEGDIYFLEHRAPGTQLDFSDYGDDMLFSEAFNKYLSRLELLANATQEQYNKFFDDIEMMRKESLKPDCCSLGNLFYDTNIGFSFIDVYPITPGEEDLSVKNIFKIVLNPKFSYKGINIIPTERVEKYNELIKTIYEKILNSLRLFNYSEDEIQKFLDKKIHVFSDGECVEYENIENYIEKHYNPYRIMI